MCLLRFPHQPEERNGRPSRRPNPALLSRLNQNINALGSAIEEIGIWIDQRSSAETSHRINEHLETLSDNSDAIAELLVDLIDRWTPEGETDPED